MVTNITIEHGEVVISWDAVWGDTHKQKQSHVGRDEHGLYVWTHTYNSPSFSSTKKPFKMHLSLLVFPVKDFYELIEYDSGISDVRAQLEVSPVLTEFLKGEKLTPEPLPERKSFQYINYVYNTKK